MPETKPLTMVVCPVCHSVHAVPKAYKSIECRGCKTMFPINKCYKPGLKRIEETGEEIWVGVKEE